MLKARAHVIISGKVQGVYFRVETQEQAQGLGVAGWVRNRPDDTVEGIFEGEKENVEKLIHWCRQGPPKAVVSDVKIEWEDYKGDFPGFGIAY